jgi:hypothetical protein
VYVFRSIQIVDLWLTLFFGGGYGFPIFLEVEHFSQCLSKASSLSYAAGTADFDSINNFDKSSASSTSRNEAANLEQSRRAIQEAKTSLDRILTLLGASEQTLE